MMTAADRERFERIKRGQQYGCTLKDLAWLIRLVERLEKRDGERSGDKDR